MTPDTPFWQTDTIRLRGFEPSDIAVLEDWLRDADGQSRLEHVEAPLTTAQRARWLEARIRPGFDNAGYPFLIETLTGTAVGSLTTFDCSPRVGTFSYGLDIAAAHRRNGYAKAAIGLILAFYFGELRYQKVNVRVHSDNLPSIALHEGLGFQREGVLRRTVFTGGRHKDDICFGLTCEEFAARA